MMVLFWGFLKKKSSKTHLEPCQTPMINFFFAKIKLRPVLHNPKYASDIFLRIL